MIIAQKFASEREMQQWLVNPQNLEDVKKKYPASKYSGSMNLIDKQVEISKKKKS